MVYSYKVPYWSHTKLINKICQIAACPNSSSGSGSILVDNALEYSAGSCPQLCANCEVWVVGGCWAVGALWWKLGGIICAGYGPHLGVGVPRMCFLIFLWVLLQRIK